MQCYIAKEISVVVVERDNVVLNVKISSEKTFHGDVMGIHGLVDDSESYSIR